MLGSFIAIPLGQVIAGPLAPATGTRTTLIGGSLVIVLATGGALLTPAVRRLTDTRAATPLPK